MIHKMIIMECFVFAWTIFLAMLSDTVIIGLFALIGTLITTAGTVISIVINKKVNAMAVKQDEVHKQIDGKMTELLSAATGKASAEATIKGKDEVIDILKQTEPLK